MTLRIGRLSKPRLLTDDLLQALRKGGELALSEINQIADKDRYRQKSYDDEIRDLCELTGLCFHYDGVLSLRADPIIDVNPEPERRFQLLTRMPHFRKWLDLQFNNDNSVWHSTQVNTVDEQDVSRIGDFRESRFEQWADDLESDLTTSIESRFDDGVTDPIRVTDDCLFYNTGGAAPTQEQAQRITVLLLLLAAKQRGSAVELDRIATQVNQSVETIREWIVSYFDPIGIPVSSSETTAWLTTSVHYESHRFNSASALLKRTGHSNALVQQETPRETLVSSFREVFSQPAELTVKAEPCPIDFLPTLEEPRFIDGGSSSVAEFIQQREGLEPTKEGYSILIPAPSEEALRRPFDNSVRHLLESPAETEDISAPEWELGHLFRERYRYAGSVPLFTASEPGDLTAFGAHLQSEGLTRPKLRCLLFVTNPALRLLFVLVEMNRYTVRIESGAWRVIQNDTSKPLLDVLSQLLRTSAQTEAPITPAGDADKTSRRLVTFAEKLGIVKHNPVTQSLEIPPSVLNELTTYNLLDWYDRIVTQLGDASLNELEA